LSITSREALRVLVGFRRVAHEGRFAEDAQRHIEEIRVRLVDAVAQPLVFRSLDPREHIGIARGDVVGLQQILLSGDDPRQKRRGIDVHVLVVFFQI
jgi:hypothetical protein